jgi:hypothetical protein
VGQIAIDFEPFGKRTAGRGQLPLAVFQGHGGLLGQGGAGQAAGRMAAYTPRKSIC